MFFFFVLFLTEFRMTMSVCSSDRCELCLYIQLRREQYLLDNKNARKQQAMGCDIWRSVSRSYAAAVNNAVLYYVAQQLGNPLANLIMRRARVRSRDCYLLAKEVMFSPLSVCLSACYWSDLCETSRNGWT